MDIVCKVQNVWFVKLTGYWGSSFDGKSADTLIDILYGSIL